MKKSVLYAMLLRERFSNDAAPLLEKRIYITIHARSDASPHQ